MFMNGLSKLFGVCTLAAIGLATTGCADPFKVTEYEPVQGPTVYKGVTADQLDDTAGKVRNAVIYAPGHYKTGVDTIAEIHVGSVRGCFTQLADAAAVNGGTYRIDCVGQDGAVVARFETSGATYGQYIAPEKGQTKGTYKSHLELSSRTLQPGQF
jgi:hypothetical protein